MLILFFKESDQTDSEVIIRPVTEQKNPGENPNRISLNFIFPFQSWKYLRLESPPAEPYLQHYNPASGVNLNRETGQ